MILTSPVLSQLEGTDLNYLHQEATNSLQKLNEGNRITVSNCQNWSFMILNGVGVFYHC